MDLFLTSNQLLNLVLYIYIYITLDLRFFDSVIFVNNMITDNATTL